MTLAGRRGVVELVRRPLPELEIVATGLAFPEGPVAFSDGSVVVVELYGGRLTRIDRDGEVSVIAELGGFPNGAAIGPDGAVYVANNGVASPDGVRRVGAIQRVELQTGEFHDIYTGHQGGDLEGPNDLVFDATGNMWFTDISRGELLYASPDGGSIQCPIAGVNGPNGVGLSPDGGALIWAETWTRHVYQVELSKPGCPVPFLGCTFASLAVGEPDWSTLVAGAPGAMELDSLAVQSNGVICIGTLVDGGVLLADPAGGPLVLLELPGNLREHAVTNICFGGPDMRTAYLTLGQLGALARCEWPFAGAPLSFGA